jgi:hypothetical protein
MIGFPGQSLWQRAKGAGVKGLDRGLAGQDPASGRQSARFAGLPL